jgi:hypothetical protein
MTSSPSLSPRHYSPEYFWPGAFAQNDEIDNLTRETTFSYGAHPPNPLPSSSIFFYLSPPGEELIIDCKVMEVNRAVERYSLRKEYFDAASDLLDTLPETQTSFTHTNSSQVPNLVMSLLSRPVLPSVTGDHGHIIQPRRRSRDDASAPSLLFLWHSKPCKC